MKEIQIGFILLGALMVLVIGGVFIDAAFDEVTGPKAEVNAQLTDVKIIYDASPGFRQPNYQTILILENNNTSYRIILDGCQIEYKNHIGDWYLIEFYDSIIKLKLIEGGE